MRNIRMTGDACETRRTEVAHTGSDVNYSMTFINIMHIHRCKYGERTKSEGRVEAISVRNCIRSCKR
jgi:hypothetical protein